MADDRPPARDNFHASVQGSGSATNYVVNGNHVNAAWHWTRIILELIGIGILLYLLISPAHGFMNV